MRKIEIACYVCGWKLDIYANDEFFLKKKINIILKYNLNAIFAVLVYRIHSMNAEHTNSPNN